MRAKKPFYAEAAYALGLLVLALGTALMEKADFGMSMVVAPAYLIYLKLSQTLPWFTFGMAEYCFQAVLLALLSLIMGRFRWTYLFSFVTAVLYGLALDAMMGLAAAFPAGGFALRAAYYLAGMALGSFGVALLFHTYITPEAYELFVKELTRKSGKETARVKTVYDLCSCLLAVGLSFLFFGFGHFEGVKAGTVLCALVNGLLIGQCGQLLERLFVFRDGLRLRRFFEGME